MLPMMKLFKFWLHVTETIFFYSFAGCVFWGFHCSGAGRSRAAATVVDEVHPTEPASLRRVRSLMCVNLIFTLLQKSLLWLQFNSMTPYPKFHLSLAIPTFWTLCGVNSHLAALHFEFTFTFEGGWWDHGDNGHGDDGAEHGKLVSGRDHSSIGGGEVISVSALGVIFPVPFCRLWFWAAVMERATRQQCGEQEWVWPARGGAGRASSSGREEGVDCEHQQWRPCRDWVLDCQGLGGCWAQRHGAHGGRGVVGQDEKAALLSLQCKCLPTLGFSLYRLVCNISWILQPFCLNSW